MSKAEIRDAATVILIRDTAQGPKVLMGQRGRGAAFMPNKFVFPGGAVDPSDSHVPLAQALAPNCIDRLNEGAPDGIAQPLAAAAIRETWEETGQILGTPSPWPDPPADWAGFAATGHRPSAEGLSFVFRAITPPGRPRRFDARFFLANASALVSDPDDFSHASDELSHLGWIPLGETRNYDLPFITQVVLAEARKLIQGRLPPENVPFFKNDDEESLFLSLNGRAP